MLLATRGPDLAQVHLLSEHLRLAPRLADLLLLGQRHEVFRLDEVLLGFLEVIVPGQVADARVLAQVLFGAGHYHLLLEQLLIGGT